MAAPIVLVGTGTSVGKTYVGERLLRVLAAKGYAAVGYKPIESGFSSDSGDSDIARLSRASSFHVKPPLKSLTFLDPVSPHLAARREGKTILLDAIRDEVQRASASPADALLVELPGGAFSPVTESTCCAELAKSFKGARIILVAPDRLGVLHDLGATTRGCAAIGLPLLGIILNAPADPDAATGTNAMELHHVTTTPLLASLGRAAVDSSLAADPLVSLAQRLLSLPG